MAHTFTVALQQTGRVRQACTLKEADIYMGREHIDVCKWYSTQACNRAAVMQDFPNFIPASSHHLKPLPRDCAQLTLLSFHPRIDGRITLHRSVKPHDPVLIMSRFHFRAR